MLMRLVHCWGARAKHVVLMRLPSSLLTNTCNQLMGLFCLYPEGLASSKSLKTVHPKGEGNIDNPSFLE